MNKTSIGWTDLTVNPVRYRTADGRVVWACEKVSPGCTHCYAESLSRRYSNRRAGEWNAAVMSTLTPFIDEKALRAMLTCKPASEKRCFLGDMTDVFGEWVPDDLLDRLFAAMAIRHDVTWQVLTKRADRMLRYMTTGASEQGMQGRYGALIDASFRLEEAGLVKPFMRDGSGSWWPPKNVWLGVSCEDQQRADERIPALLNTPAAVRFISAEPLLGPIDLWSARYQVAPGTFNGAVSSCKPSLDWGIAGLESGAGFRPGDVAWIRSIADQFEAAGKPLFVKQGAGARPGMPTGDSRLDALKQFPAAAA